MLHLQLKSAHAYGLVTAATDERSFKYLRSNKSQDRLVNLSTESEIAEKLDIDKLVHSLVSLIIRKVNFK
jgi:hypothetical protein